MFCVCAAAASDSPPPPSVVLHVSPSATNNGDGSEAKPFATLEQARDRMREIRSRPGILEGPLTVLVHGGKYAVRRTFALRVGAPPLKRCARSAGNV